MYFSKLLRSKNHNDGLFPMIADPDRQRKRANGEYQFSGNVG